jgi:hypothetical protein
MPAAVVSANSTSDALRITQVGTGNALVVEDSANPDATPFVVNTTGAVGIGAAPGAGRNLAVSAPITGAAISRAITSIGTVQSDVTDAASYYATFGNTAAGVSANSLTHYTAIQGGFLGSVGAQYGFWADATLVGATTTNIGFLSNIPSGTGRWNFYANGTAANYFAGSVGIGTTSPGALLNVVANTSTDAVRITQTGTGNALVVEDNANPDANPFIVDTAGRVVAGHTSALVLAPGTAVPYIQTNLSVSSTDFVSMGISNWFAGAQGASLHLSKARSAAIGTPGVVSANDVIGRVQFNGNDGTGFIASARIEGAVDGTPDTNDMPGRLVFSTTADGASSPTERMRISSTGLVTVAGTLEGATISTTGAAAHLDLSATSIVADGTDTNINITISPKGTGEVIITKPFGYGGSGTGGTVTQLTSRTTGVTLNKLSGQITLFAATALSGHASNEFTLTNSFIDPTDVVHVCFASGLTGASYGVTVTAVNSGSCKIAVSNFNNSATPADTPVLNFVVIKGVNA